jgi:hypothetical protein
MERYGAPDSEEAQFYEREAEQIEAKILRTKATTIAGVIALLEHEHIDADEIAIESLRALDARATLAGEPV